MTEEKHIGSADPFDKNFNWFLFLERSAEDLCQNLADVDAAKSAADNWVTCACGQLCKNLPRAELGGYPLDDELRHLGLVFADHIGVIRDRVSSVIGIPELRLIAVHSLKNKAYLVLIEIEKRTSELLQK